MVEDTELEEDLELDQEPENAGEIDTADEPDQEDAGNETEEELLFKEDQQQEELDPHDEKTPLITSFRQRERAKDKELRRLRKELEEAKKAGGVKEETEVLGPKPKAADFLYDEEKHAEALLEWGKKAERIKAAQEAEVREYNQKKASYDSQKAKVMARVDDFEEAEDAVVVALSTAQQNAILKVAETPTALVYSLGKNPKDLKALAEITDPIRFIAELVRFEARKKGMGTTASKPAPEGRPPRSASGGASGTVDRELARLEKIAAQTGDRTPIREYRQRQREAANRK